MVKPKLIAAKELAAITADAATGLSRRKLQQRYPNAPERLLRAILQAGIGADEWREMMADNLRSLAAEAAAQLRQELRNGRVSPNSLPLAIAILTDKAEQVAQAGASVSVSAKVTVSGLSRADVLALARGERLPAAAPEQQTAHGPRDSVTLLP